MSTRLRDAAVRHLRSLGAATGEGAVRRLTMDVEVEGRVEMVTLSLRDGELQCVSSDARNDGPHVLAALQFVAGMETREDSSPPGSLPSISAQPPEQSSASELADALDDLLTAITRIGVDKAQHAPSVDAALEWHRNPRRLASAVSSAAFSRRSDQLSSGVWHDFSKAPPSLPTHFAPRRQPRKPRCVSEHGWGLGPARGRTSSSSTTEP